MNITTTKEWNSAVCDNMDGPWGYYAKWNRSDREKLITIWFHSYVDLKKEGVRGEKTK